MSQLELGQLVWFSSWGVCVDRDRGLDASIGFETARAENVGVHFINDTLGVVSEL